MKGPLRDAGEMLRAAYAAHPGGFVGLIAIQLSQAVLAPAGAWLLASLIERIGRRSSAVAIGDRFWLVLAALLAVASVERLLAPLQSFLSAESGRRLLVHVQSRVYGKINSIVGLSPFEDPRLHDTIHIVAQRASHGPGEALGLLLRLSGGFLTVASYLGLLLALSPLLGAVLVLSLVPHLATQIRMSRQRAGLWFDNSLRQRRASYLGMLLTDATFAKEVRVFGLGAHFLGRLQATYEEIHAAERRQQRGEIRNQAQLALLASLVTGGALVVVAVRAFEGALGVDKVILYISALAALQSALTTMVTAWAGIHESLLFQQQYRDLMALPSTLAVPSRPRAVRRLKAGIEFRGVSFRYGGQGPSILRDVNFTVPRGHCLALVGANGAGKTTIAKLLTRCYDPTEGQVLWDGTDIREFDPADLRKHIAAIFQDFIHYEMTAYENIALGDLDAFDRRDAVRRAAAQAGADAVIGRLPKQYDTVLSRWLTEDDRGVDLSGGEWQKIALARMLMRAGDLMILDEPTAALDPESEYELYRRFVELVSGRTSLLISHRLSTVRMADRIAVLRGGTIAEIGSHAELMAAGGTYAGLYAMQAEQYAGAVGDSPPQETWRG